MRPEPLRTGPEPSGTCPESLRTRSEPFRMRSESRRTRRESFQTRSAGPALPPGIPRAIFPPGGGKMLRRILNRNQDELLAENRRLIGELQTALATFDASEEDQGTLGSVEGGERRLK